MAADTTSPSRDPLRSAFVVLLLAASAMVLSLANAADPDLWGHVRFGADQLAAHAVPRTCTHTYAAPDHPWVDQEYLSQIVFAAAAAAGGAPAVVALKCVLGLALFALIIGVAARRDVGLLVLGVVVVLVAYNVAPGWNVRPHLFTYALFATMIAILDAYCTPAVDSKGLLHGALLLVALFVPWANMHGGFFAGFCVLAGCLVVRSVEALWSGGAGSMRRVCGYAAIVVGAATVTVLNPYGLALHRWLLRDALVPPSHISEWMPLHVGDLRFLPFVLLLAATVIAWGCSRLRRDAAQTVLLAVTVWQSWLHVRHIPFFGLLAAFWVPPHLDDAWRRLIGRRSIRPRPSITRMLRVAAYVAACGLFAAVAFRSRALWVDLGLYPVRAFEFMAARRLEGRLVAQPDWAQYAIAAFAPRTTVGFDLRLGCYPRAVAEENWAFFLGADADGEDAPAGTVDGSAVLVDGDPDLVLLNRSLPHGGDVVEIENARAMVTGRRPDWVLLYQDAVAQLWGRRVRYDEPSSPDHLPSSARQISDEVSAGFAPWPALPGAAHDAVIR